MRSRAAGYTSSTLCEPDLCTLGPLTPAPQDGCWSAVDVMEAVVDDWRLRLSRGSRSQYRLRCSSCQNSFYAAEAADSTGDASSKLPTLVVEYLLP